MRDGHFHSPQFSEREQAVFQLLLKGMSNKEIAEALAICQKTVEEHLTSIYKKIGTASRAKAMVWWNIHNREFRDN
jgi:DNA-binding NarL/FixJ family response regulator